MMIPIKSDLPFLNDVSLINVPRDAEKIVALKQVAERFAEVNAHKIEVTIPEDATYLRFECWGRGESMAWTQPFFIG